MTNSSRETGCCTPQVAERIGLHRNYTALEGAGLRVAPDAVSIPGGSSIVGTRVPVIPDDGEGPIRRSKIKPFRMGATAVTNAQFQAFVDATGFVTEAEKYGWSYVFEAQVPASHGLTQGVEEAPWWRKVYCANWRDICGPNTMRVSWAPEHPVVHVSWNDAVTYAKWVGGRLPTEAEWEHAARGGLGDVKFPWGNQEPDDVSYLPCNIWQGKFPKANTAQDGFETTAPAKYYEPNGYGLYNLAGNVWEWLSDAYRIRSLRKPLKQREAKMKGYKLSKGGSFLCHRSYCYRYRIAARSGTSPESTTSHQGFRVVWQASR